MDFKNGVKWGIIGVGDVCEVKSGPAFQNVDGSELVMVMRRSADKVEDFANRHGVPKWTTDADELINDPDVNAIYIATRPDSHAFYVEKAAASGKPIYVEKPMARSYEECQSMLKICSEHEVQLFTAYYRRELPLFLHVKNLIESGIIGDIRSVDIKVHKSSAPDILQGIVGDHNWRVKPEISGGGYFIDLASHQLDFLDSVFGPIESAHGYATNHGKLYEAEDQVTGTFKFENGITGVGSWIFNLSDGQEQEKTVIYGSEGRLTFTFFDDFHILIEQEGEEPQRIDYSMPKHIQQPLVQTIVDDLLGKGTCISNGESAARTAKVVEMLTKY